MAMAPYPIPVTASQVGTYFVAQYYQVLQHQPDVAYQFYTDSSIMVRVDGSRTERAATMLQIHTLVSSLNYARIEVKAATSLESWNGGVLVMVSGLVQLKNYSGWRKFVETFFLAPQEKGFFVLNDVFHFIEEESMSHHPGYLFVQSNIDSKLHAPTIPEPVPNYLGGEDVQAREYVAPADAKENGPVDNYSFSEQRLQQVPALENTLEEDSTEQLNGSLQNTTNASQVHLAAPAEEPAGEPQKHTYASILRVAKAQSTASAAPQPTVTKNAPATSEWSNAAQSTSQPPTATSSSFERSGEDTVEDYSAMEDEDEIRSVYVRNLSPTATEAEIEEEFKAFGKIVPDGVVIRSRKDVGVCYAFVEFEEMSGVHNAVKAGSAHVAGRQVYIEGRRPNSNIPSRVGRGRGRGRGSYQVDASRGGRFGGRSYSRGGGYDGVDREYNRTRANGYYRPNTRQDRGVSGQVSRSGQIQ